MKFYNEKIKIGEFKKIPVYIDWKYLTVERGRRKEELLFQIILGRFFYITGTILFLIILGIDLSLGNFLLFEMGIADRPIDIVAWSAVAIIIYSMYLRRDRSRYFDTLDLKAVTQLRDKIDKNNPPDSVELLDFVDYSILNILDDLVSNNQEDIYDLLMLDLLQLKEVEVLLERLGLEKKSLLQKIKSAGVEIQGDKSYQINKLLYDTFVLAYKYGFSYVGGWVIFLKLALDEFAPVFLSLNIQKGTLLAVLEWTRAQALNNRYKKSWKYHSSLKPKTTVNRSFTSAFTPTLNQYARDLTKEVAEGSYNYAIAREQKIQDLIQALRQQKAMVLLVGEPGVGKTTILKSLAVKTVVEDVPKELQDKRLVEFDFQKAISNSKSTSELRKTIARIFKEVSRASNVILVIDDIEELINIRKELSVEVLSVITESIEKHELKLVATTSRSGFSRYIKPNSAFSNMFDVIELDEPSPDIALQIVLDERDTIESKYKIKIEFAAIKASVELTTKYDSTRQLPYKALDVLEDACVLALDQGLKFVSSKEIEAVVSKDSGIKVGSVSKTEQEKLVNLEKLMHERVIGQDRAITAVASALRRARAGLSPGNKPIASFLFFGPTGVGKTEVSRTLSRIYFGDEKLLTRLDMSEFQENKNVERLLGYMEGHNYVPGLLTEQIRHYPFSLVLLDEIEKANKRVLDLFLQVLDEGRITDGLGRKVDFKNTIIIATSNIGSKMIAEKLEQGESYENTYKEAMQELRNILRIEFLNRFDSIIMFKPLSRLEIEKIAELMMNQVHDKLKEQGIELRFTDEAVEQLGQKGYSPIYGAREMRRVIQEVVENKIADLIISGKVKSGDVVTIYNLNNINVQ